MLVQLQPRQARNQHKEENQGKYAAGDQSRQKNLPLLRVILEDITLSHSAFLMQPLGGIPGKRKLYLAGILMLSTGKKCAKVYSLNLEMNSILLICMDIQSLPTMVRMFGQNTPDTVQLLGQDHSDYRMGKREG